MIYGTIGIHPHETNDSLINSENIVKNFNENLKIIGIGESGLDFYYNHSDVITQKKCFLQHIFASQKTNKPLIVHSRNAENEIYDILSSEFKNQSFKILMHCFTGSKEFAYKLLDEYMKIDNQNTDGWYNDDYLEVVQEIVELNLNLDFEISQKLIFKPFVYSEYFSFNPLASLIISISSIFS